MSQPTSHRRARHSLLLGCALAALTAPAGAAPGTAPTTAPTATSADIPAAPQQAENTAAPLDIEVPAGWQPLPEQSARISIELNTELVAEPPVPELTGAPFTAQARTWRGPDAGLVVSWLQAGAPAPFPSKAARALLDHVRATPADAALDPGDTRLVSWNEAVTQGVAEGELTWQHLANQTTTLSRALVYATADGRPGMVRADCVIPAIDTAALTAPRAACERALDSLTLTVLPARLASLVALPPAGPEALAPGSASLAASAPTGQTAGNPAGSMPPAPSLRAPGPGSDTVMIIPPSDREERSPPWLYLLGGVVLAAGLYLTLRSRRAAGRMDDQDDRGNDEERT
ncbi:MAG TPA: hypothetical protein VNM90_08060 [Haliangium sp.]|nr:hypothetical protein [Haliangium sp.]